MRHVGHGQHVNAGLSYLSGPAGLETDQEASHGHCKHVLKRIGKKSFSKSSKISSKIFELFEKVFSKSAKISSKIGRNGSRCATLKCAAEEGG